MPLFQTLMHNRMSKILLIVLGVLLLLFIVLNYLVLPAYVHHGSTLAVPAVVGLPLAQARAMLDSADLRPVEAETRPDPVYGPGFVVQQNPVAGSVVKGSRRVYLTVSGGEIFVIVPSLRGRSMRDARFALERNSLALGTVSYDTSDTFPENTIIEQSIPTDTRVARGTSVSIVVSQGRLLRDRIVPDLVGKSLVEAERILTEAGLTLGKINYQLSFDLVPNTVVDQFPRAGEALGTGEAVDLFVVKVGRPTEEIAVPNN
jgi:eukaryotic-like serine/threonine-protein kinase